mmetsp:Transcript_31598/g.71032  ORF Transcript_31598/g.71032 Transcript_31598/m.71032 type:complete len:215 (-) Transcript_31598:1495-2139(-)
MLRGLPPASHGAAPSPPPASIVLRILEREPWMPEMGARRWKAPRDCRFIRASSPSPAPCPPPESLASATSGLPPRPPPEPPRPPELPPLASATRGFGAGPLPSLAWPAFGSAALASAGASALDCSSASTAAEVARTGLWAASWAACAAASLPTRASISASIAPEDCQMLTLRRPGQPGAPSPYALTWYPRPLVDTSGNLESRRGCSLPPSERVT